MNMEHEDETSAANATIKARIDDPAISWRN